VKLTLSQIFYCAAPLSGAFGGLLATGLAEIEFGGYNRWPWIFFVEGSLTIVVAIAAFFFLPDTPGKAKFLSEEEQWYIVHVLRADLSGAAQTDKIDDEKFSWAAVSHGSMKSAKLLRVRLIICRSAWLSSTSTPS
jgi:MFS family permease